MKNIFVILLIFSSLNLFSQSDDLFYTLQKKENGGSLNINQPDNIASLIKKHIDLNKKWMGIRGYRIQLGLFSGKKSREKAYNLKSEFLLKHPNETDIYISYSAPYFYVRVGNFYNKDQALKMQKDLLKEYPGAFIVSDFITIEEYDE